ncbi:hypothetical protein GCM10009753_03940 [Streptantibioticus ferralitis]
MGVVLSLAALLVVVRPGDRVSQSRERGQEEGPFELESTHRRCPKNPRPSAREGPFGSVWVQPAAGDSGTALGGALYAAQAAGDPVKHMTTAALGRGWSDEETEVWLQANRVSYSRPPDVATVAARALADNKVIGWFQGRSEFGPRALGHRSILANPCYRQNLERLNDIKGREQFRPVAPMVLLERAAEIFDGPLPSPYMLFTHQVRPDWAERIPAALHVDGSARSKPSTRPTNRSSPAC